MRIFDSRWQGPHGIGRFASELCARLPDFTPITMRGRPSNPFDPVALHAYLWRSGSDFFFSPGYNPPAASPCPFAFCIHDLTHLCVQDESSALKRAYYHCVVRPAIHRAAVVLTVSEFSRRAICEWAGVSTTKVHNVGNGVSAAFTAHGPAHEAGAPYFLYVGNHKPHKNFTQALRAFASSGLARDFIFISTGSASAELRFLIGALGLSERIRFAGCVSDDELACLYRGATALVFVSLHEGFGLPIVEAMSCGTPVLTSCTSSMPEIAADAALLVDPLDRDAIGHAMARLASDATLRSTLRQRGLQRAKAFTWDRTVCKVQRALCEA